MSPRWNANTVLLTVFILILVGAGVDYGRRVLGGTKPEPPPLTTSVSLSAPSFKVGDLAPDFVLPDAHKKAHKLSELVKSKTILFFACGCANCRQVQSMLGSMRTKNKSSVPPVITVTSSLPETEESWIRDTDLEQTMLFWKAGVSPDPMAIYKGKPCPRIYVLESNRKVKFIGSSMNDVPQIQVIGTELAKELGSRFGGTQSLMPPGAEKPRAQPKALPGLPPYAQPQSALPGA